MPDIPVWLMIFFVIIAVAIVSFLVNFMTFFSSVPKELKRIADALEKMNKNNEAK